MKISRIRLNGMHSPVGYRYDFLTISFEVVDSIGIDSEYIRVEVSERDDLSEIIYVREGSGLSPAGIHLALTLKPRTRYFYRIYIRSDAGEECVSDIASFETGKMDEPWRAKRISIDEKEEMHPIFHRRFQMEGEVESARLYICGLGLFEAYLNDEKIGSEYLAPYMTDYDEFAQIITLPVTNLKRMENEWKVMLGKGWYIGEFGLKGKKNIYGKRPWFIAEMHVVYTDGSEACICSDEHWEYQKSDITDSGIYYGEDIDRRISKDVNNVCKKARLIEPGEKEYTIRLKDRCSLPILEKETVEVKELIRSPLGEIILDMGQNLAGFVEFDADWKEGEEIVLEFGEILQNGNFYRDNYREARSTFRYISSGVKETVRAHFTYFGFRYVKVSGTVGDIRKERFRAKVLYSDLERIGYIHTSHEKINRLYENTLWGLKSNFLDLPTDCPQRNERLGWTGDAQVFSATASYHMNTRAFYHKYIEDLKTEQRKLGGAVPNFVPNPEHKPDSTNVWGDIATFLPMVLYRFYGDQELLRQAFPMMKAWVDYLSKQAVSVSRKEAVLRLAFQFGDWLALDGMHESSFKGATEDEYIGMMYYFASARKICEAAQILGYAEEQKKYEGLAERIKAEIIKEYFTENGRLAQDTQTAYIVALKFGVYPNKEKLVESFKQRLKKDGYRIKAGFVGAPLLCGVLADIGEIELAYDFLLKEEFPSWLYCVNLGATTVWERWNSVLSDGTIHPAGMNSLNHYAYGSVMEFLYADAAGLKPLEAGFQRVSIQPKPDARIPNLNLRYHSVGGTYEVAYRIREDGSLSFEIKVPFAAKAELSLPDYSEKNEIKLLRAGLHRFTYMPTRDYLRPYSEKTRLYKLAERKEAVEILKKHTPILHSMMKGSDFSFETLAFFKTLDFIPVDKEGLDRAIEQIKKIRLPVNAESSHVTGEER